MNEARELVKMARSLIAKPNFKEGADMEKLMRALTKFGATDSEPQWKFEHVMGAALREEPFPVRGASDWELFSSVPGWKGAANKLTKQAKKVYDAIGNMPLRDARELADWHGLNFS